ncbi:MAG TPA: protein kinase [Anaeromyxobacteraceae bacterium]|nr:protein kinase [Anaeromyxobacteraceae bacterium]
MTRPLDAGDASARDAENGDPTGAEPPPHPPSAQSATLRPGELSALIEQLARGPPAERGAAWKDALRPGAVIGRFELVREIGRGGFGVVYEARDRELGRLVAFKAVRAGFRSDARAERLLREAEAAALLSHPNIVTLFDVGQSPQGPYLVMELLRGLTLAERIERGPLPVRDALRIFVEMAKGLAHAHAQGVTHRDLKPGNVFLCDDGQVKVLDLGMAHAFGHRKVDGGTPAYMAPEQWRGAPEDERTDVFAMGVVLFEMIAGAPPFASEAGSSVRGATAAPDLAIPEEPGLRDLIRRMLAQDPVKRPRDAGEVLAALTALAGEPPRDGAAASTPAPARRAPPTSERTDRAFLATVVAAEIAGYAAHSVDTCAAWKARFNRSLAAAIRGVPEEERVLLDTGAGAAICFLGDPEAAMACAVGLREGMGPAAAGGPRLRVGVHLGAVRLVPDVNGNLEAIGEGLNEADRVMRLAGEDQALVSRSFFEVAACLSESHRTLFRAGGVRQDEQGRSHEVYELRRPGAPEGAEAPATGPATPAALDPEAVDRLERSAAALLGPIARHLVATARVRARSLRDLGEALASHLAPGRDRDELLRLCGSPPPREAAASTLAAAGSIPPAALERAGRDLAVHLGPMAPILVARAAARARSEEELYDLLAAEIASPSEREAFKRKRPR